MKIVGLVFDTHQAKTAPDLSFDEIVLMPAGLSRAGRLPLNELNELISVFEERKIKTYLQWDVPLRESELNSDYQKLAPYFSNIAGIRVADLGAYQLLKEKNLSLELHLQMGQSQRNQRSLRELQELLNPARFIFSPPFSPDIPSLLSTSQAPLEITLLNRPLLFTSPRSLGPQGLSVLSTEDHRGHYEMTVYGRTFLRQNHWVSTLSMLPLLRKGSIQAVSLEVVEGPTAMERLISYLRQGNYEEIPLWEKDIGIVRQMAPETSSFLELKNQFIVDRGEKYIGEVIECRREDYLAIKALAGAALPQPRQSVRIMTPDGQSKELVLERVMDLNFNDLSATSVADENPLGMVVFLITPAPAVGVRSAVYFSD